MRATLLCISLALVVGCKTHPPEQPGSTAFRMAESLPDQGGLRHLARVDPCLYRGAQPEGDGWATLAELGVKTVINLRKAHDYEAEARAAGLDYYRIPLRADVLSTPPTDEQIETFFDIVLDPARQPVFIHCARGKDRTGTMVALYRIEVNGWRNTEAIAEMDAFGHTDYYRDLKRFVTDYRPKGFAQK